MLARVFAAAVAVAIVAAPAHAQLTKDSKLLAQFKNTVAPATESTVRIKCDDKDTILGTIVDADGYILTKLSELKGTIYVRLPDGSEYEGTRIAEHKPTDLALLKVDAKGLKAVKFADTMKVPQGNWVASSGPTSDPVAVGIVSVMTRKLTGEDDKNGGYMSVIPIDEKDMEGKAIGARLQEVSPGGAADKAGLKVDDVIVELNGKKVTDQTSMRAVLGLLENGDPVVVKALRKGETKEFKVTLGPRAGGDRGSFQNQMGAKEFPLSERRTKFPLILQTDMVIEAKNCGGPVVDLDGNVLGINIARAGRVETWVLPSEVIKPLLPDFKAGKHAPVKAVNTPPKPALPVAPAPHDKKK